MALHQIQLTYNEKQDRVLLRVSTTDNVEFQFWLTRRFIKRLWGLLVKLLEQDRPVRQQVDPEAKRTVLGIRHEGFAQQGNFSAPYEAREYQKPLGTEPLLVTRAEGKPRENGNFLLRLHPEHGQGVDVVLDTRLLHLFTKLLQQVVGKTDWDITLELYEGGRSLPVSEEQPRKLN